MRGILKKLFGRGDRLLEAARTLAGEAFVNALCSADVLVIAAIESEGLDPTRFTQAGLLAELERAAKDLDSRQDGFELFVYERDGVTCLPFFSSQAHCEQFCGEYSKARDRVYPFQVLGVKGYSIAPCGKRIQRYVLNDWTRDERVLTREEKVLFDTQCGV